MDFREIGWRGMNWIALAQDRDLWLALVNTVMNLRVPRNAGKFWSRRAPVGFPVNVLKIVDFKAAARSAKVGLNLKLRPRHSSSG
jgi:hypothetical protein